MNTQEVIERNSFIDWFSYQSEWIQFAIKKIVEIFKVKTYSYFDNSNLFIEGQRVSAVKKGMAKDIFEAMNNKIVDFSWQPDYVFLHSLVCKSGKDFGEAKMWGSPPPSDPFWQQRERDGYEVTVYDRKYGKEKKVDTGMDVQIVEDSFSLEKFNCEIHIVAGDTDHIPAIESLKRRGFKVKVYFWGHAPKELKDIADDFVNLDMFFDKLTRKP